MTMSNYVRRTKDQLAARVAQDIFDGAVVNLGIGQPTLVANHLPAAAVIAAASGAQTILHSHAYEKAAKGPLKRALRKAEIGQLAGLAFVSEDCADRFRMNFAGARARSASSRTDSTWRHGPPRHPGARESGIDSVGRFFRSLATASAGCHGIGR